MNADKHLLHLGNEEDQHRHQHAQGEPHENDGIKHGRHDLGAHFLFALLEVRDLAEHDVEEAARLARLDHGHIHFGERVRRFAHRVRQRHAVHDGIVNFLPLGFRRGIRRFLLQDHQCAAQRHARCQQAGKQAGEVLQHARGNPTRPERELPFGCVRRVRLIRRQCSGSWSGLAIDAFLEADGPQALALDLPEGLRPAAGLDLTLSNLAVRLQRSVVEGGHGTQWKNVQPSTFNAEHRTDSESPGVGSCMLSVECFMAV